MADEAAPTPPAPTPEAPKAEPKKEETKVEPKAAPEAPKSEQPKEDPTLQRLFSAERTIEELKSQLEGERAKIKQFERDSRKQSILGSLYDAFPGLSRDEIRGAALVAAEDGKVDLYSGDAEKQVSALKELLGAKVKKGPGSITTPAALGGTPGAPAKPPVNGRDPSNIRWRV